MFFEGRGLSFLTLLDKWQEVQIAGYDTLERWNEKNVRLGPTLLKIDRKLRDEREFSQRPVYRCKNVGIKAWLIQGRLSTWGSTCSVNTWPPSMLSFLVLCLWNWIHVYLCNFPASAIHDWEILSSVQIVIWLANPTAVVYLQSLSFMIEVHISQIADLA